MRKNYVYKTMLVLFAVFLGTAFTKVTAQNYVYLGTGTSTTGTFQTLPTPFGTYYEDNRTQYLVLASELQALGGAGSILNIGFDVVTANSNAMNGFNIQMGHTTATSLTAYATGLTNVYSGTHTATTGWNGFTFSAPFAWDGVSNIVIEVCWDNGAWYSNSTVNYTTTTYNSVYGRYADGQTGCAMTGSNGFGSDFTSRPNIRFEFSPPLANDAAIGALTNPTFPTCAMDSVVKVELKNFGTANLTSATVNWTINGNIQPAYAWTGNMASFGVDTVTLGTVTGGLNDGDNIVVWSSMPNAVPDSNNINDTLNVSVYNSLSGTYTIGAAGDFTSFADAINAMDNYGICAATVFEVMNGTYVEQIQLESYNGMSAANDVTFKSQSGNVDSVIVSYSSTNSGDNYVLNFNGASNFTFEDITLQNLGASYSRVVTTNTSGGNTHITIDGCKWIGMPSTSTWDSDEYASYIYGPGNDNWTLTNNTIMNGNYGLYFYGNFNQKCFNNVVENNHFMDQYYRSSYFYYQEDGKFNENRATSNTTYNFGYALYFGQNVRVEVQRNHIDGNASWPSYGLYFTGMTGDLNVFMPVTDNRVVMPKPSASRGIYASNCLFVEFAHNSVYMNSTSNFSPALYFTGGSFNKVKNNIFINGGTGSAVYISGSGVYEMDYNNISAPNGGNIGYSGTTYATLADWVTGTGFDSNSVNVNDVISDTSSFKVCNDSLWGVGTYLAAYAMDYQGDVRQDPPCIGADEFLPLSQFGFTNSPVLCNGDTLTLQQDYFDTVVWNTTDTSNTYDITAPGTQQVAVYDQCGSDTSVFTVMPQQVAVVGDTNLCEGTSAVLNTGISGGTYMWSNDMNANTSTDSVVTVDSAMTVYVEVVDMHGCASADTAVVTQSMDVVLADSASFCEGANVVLDANMQGTYLWSDGSTNQTLSVTAPGSYSVTVTDQNCVSSASSNVTEILDAVAAFADSSSHFTVVFTNASQNGTSYLWDFGDGTTSTDANPIHIYPWTIEDSTCYVVTLTVTNSCGSNTYTNDCVRVGQLVSVSEVELASLISVYPNPNAGVFTVNVKSDEAKDMSIEVLDVRGTQVFVQSYGKVNGEVNRTINLEGAAQGIYFVKVTLDGETAVYRMSVK